MSSSPRWTPLPGDSLLPCDGIARDMVEICRDAILREAEALVEFSGHMGQEFIAALELVHDCQGPLIVVGIGKSGHIAKKIASTFSSIGKPSVFVHAAEASHGDLGVIQPNSVVLVLSNSGETAELSDLIHYCRAHDIKTVALTACADSTLARNSTVTIAYGRVEEVCPNGLAPTTSTTLSLAIGDALAVGVAHKLQMAPEDFRRYHPGGKLGAKLLTVGEIMHIGEELPIVAPDMPMAEVVIVMSEKAFGVAIVAEDECIKGVITDGDMRRNVNRLWHSRAIDVATPDPILISRDLLATSAVELMAAQGITSCLVGDGDDKLVGLVHIHDCLKAGAVP